MQPSEQSQFLDAIGTIAAKRLQIINEDKPLIARYRLGTAVAVVADILNQAQFKKRAKDVAEYLVGAKLQLRFGPDAVVPKNVNTPNRNAPADFRVGSAAIEVTVNPLDDRHIEQIRQILADTSLDVWLLVRLDQRDRWQKAVNRKLRDAPLQRVAVADVETFVGQNVSEIGRFNSVEITHTLAELIAVYNDRWLPTTGSSGIRIVNVDPEHD